MFDIQPLFNQKVHILLFRASVELDQILWVNLITVENYINLWISHIVHTTVIKVGEAGILGGRPAVHGMADRVLSDEHPGQEHCLVGWLACKYWRGESVSLQGGVVLPRGVTELTGVFGVPGKVAAFAIDIAMASCQPPVKVKCTYSLYVAVSCAVKQHSLLNIQCALDLSQLCFLPAEEFP